MVVSPANSQTFILIDMAWWQGSSRRRGIGVYLTAFLTKYFDPGQATCLWLFPRALDSAEVAEFRVTFPNGEIISPLMIESGQVVTTTGRQIHCSQIKYALSGSPFERPWSLLNEITTLQKWQVPLKVVVHDLLPLEFPEQILGPWTSEDQQLYHHQVAGLPQVVEILVTGKVAKAQVGHHFPALLPITRIIPFGETADWFAIPAAAKDLPPLVKQPYVMTIAGGEWRKNLQGTLEFFAQHFPTSWRLVVICRLGKREWVKFVWLTWRLRIFSRVIWTGEVSELIKWRYYLHARALLSLSFGEGLNLPVLEAQAVHVPVITLETPEENVAQLVVKVSGL